MTNKELTYIYNKQFTKNIESTCIHMYFNTQIYMMRTDKIRNVIYIYIYREKKQLMYVYVYVVCVDYIYTYRERKFRRRSLKYMFCYPCFDEE